MSWDKGRLDHLLLAALAALVVSSACSKDKNESIGKSGFEADSEDQAADSDVIDTSFYGGELIKSIIDIELERARDIDFASDETPLINLSGPRAFVLNGTGKAVSYDFETSTATDMDKVTHKGTEKVFAVDDGTYWVHDGDRFIRYGAKAQGARERPKDEIGIGDEFALESVAVVGAGADFFAYQTGDFLVIIYTADGALKAMKVPSPRRLGSGELARLRSGGKLLGRNSFWFLAKSRILLFVEDETKARDGDEESDDPGLEEANETMALAEDDEKAADGDKGGAVDTYSWYEAGFRTNIEKSVKSMNLPLELDQKRKLRVGGRGIAFAGEKFYEVQADAIAGSDKPDESEGGGEEDGDGPESSKDFAEILPLSESYCVQCHNWATEESEWLARKEDIVERLVSKSMPPEGAPQPKGDELDELIEWIQ